MGRTLAAWACPLPVALFAGGVIGALHSRIKEAAVDRSDRLDLCNSKEKEGPSSVSGEASGGATAARERSSFVPFFSSKNGIIITPSIQQDVTTIDLCLHSIDLGQFVQRQAFAHAEHPQCTCLATVDSFAARGFIWVLGPAAREVVQSATTSDITGPPQQREERERGPPSFLFLWPPTLTSDGGRDDQNRRRMNDQSVRSHLPPRIMSDD